LIQFISVEIRGKREKLINKSFWEVELAGKRGLKKILPDSTFRQFIFFLNKRLGAAGRSADVSFFVVSSGISRPSTSRRGHRDAKRERKRKAGLY